jgi:hypothetical protein
MNLKAAGFTDLAKNTKRQKNKNVSSFILFQIGGKNRNPGLIRDAGIRSMYSKKYFFSAVIRVTRLGEFSPTGRLFKLSKIFGISKRSRHFFSALKVMYMNFDIK